MKDQTKNPSDFLGTKILSPLEKTKIKGGMKHQVVQCTGQYQVQQVQQQQQRRKNLNF